MSDARVLHRKKDLDLDDEDYLVKLLTKLPIVKWTPLKSLGFVNPHHSTKLPEGTIDYEELLPYMKFMPGGLTEIPSESVPVNPNISKYSQQVLTLLFPTQEWVENGERFRQKISTETTSRLETALLTDGVRALMVQAQARPTGICPIRENLLHRCFDEMIRLATIDSGERGHLMRTVQDEIRMTLTCYKTLLEAAVDFGSRKFNQVLQTLSDLHHEVDTLTKAKERYQFENQEMRIKMRHLDRKNTEERTAILEYRKNKLAALRRTNEQFIAMLDMIGVDNYRHLI